MCLSYAYIYCFCVTCKRLLGCIRKMLNQMSPGDVVHINSKSKCKNFPSSFDGSSYILMDPKLLFQNYVVHFYP